MILVTGGAGFIGSCFVQDWLAHEAEPLVVEVEGQTLRLTGSAEERYKEWRQLLRQIYEKETGLPPPAAAPAPATGG
mgnify:CR=1 FL=1